MLGDCSYNRKSFGLGCERAPRISILRMAAVSTKCCMLMELLRGCPMLHTDRCVDEITQIFHHFLLCIHFDMLSHSVRITWRNCILRRSYIDTILLRFWNVRALRAIICIRTILRQAGAVVSICWLSWLVFFFCHSCVTTNITKLLLYSYIDTDIYHKSMGVI